MVRDQELRGSGAVRSATLIEVLSRVLPKLTRGTDGRYHGPYRGHEFAIWREGKDWRAQSDTILLHYCLTRADAAQRVWDALDEAAVVNPDLDQPRTRCKAGTELIAQIGDRGFLFHDHCVEAGVPQPDDAADHSERDQDPQLLQLPWS